jgi:DNA-binding transcriptional LysR family regulator
VLELTDLRLLVAVAHAGTISAGAAECGLSLAAASARLSTLERRYDVRLLRRHRRGVTVTDTGLSWVQDAERLLHRAGDLEQELLALGHGLRESVRVATNSAAADALPEFLAAALSAVPTLRIDLTEMGSAAALDAVREGRVDLAVVSVLSERIPGCQVQELWDDPLVVIDAGARGRPPGSWMTLAEVMGGPMVGLTGTTSLQRLVDAEAARAGLRPLYRIRLPTLAAVCTVASAGVGRAIVPEAVARRNGVAPTVLAALSEPWASSHRHTVLAARTFDELPPAAAEFARFLRRHRGELAES